MDAELRLLEARIDELEAELKALKEEVQQIKENSPEDDIDKVKRLMKATRG